MVTELQSWERPHFEPGGGEPFLFYAIFGKIDSTEPLSRSRYRATGIPDGIDVMSYGPDTHPETPSRFREGFLWEQFVAENRTLSETVAHCEHCAIVRGSPVDSTTLNYLRDVVGLIAYMLDHGGCAVYDPQAFRWWSAEDWKADLFEPGIPAPLRHTVVLVSEEEGSPLKWFHTRGMRKFGRPDISVHNVPERFERPVIDLRDRLIEHQAFGHVVPEGQEVHMASLPSGGVIRHRGHLEDPDFNNVHLEASWPDWA